MSWPVNYELASQLATSRMPSQPPAALPSGSMLGPSMPHRPGTLPAARRPPAGGGQEAEEVLREEDARWAAHARVQHVPLPGKQALVHALHTSGAHVLPAGGLQAGLRAACMHGWRIHGLQRRASCAAGRRRASAQPTQPLTHSPPPVRGRAAELRQVPYGGGHHGGAPRQVLARKVSPHGDAWTRLCWDAAAACAGACAAPA